MSTPLCDATRSHRCTIIVRISLSVSDYQTDKHEKTRAKVLRNLTHLNNNWIIFMITLGFSCVISQQKDLHTNLGYMTVDIPVTPGHFRSLGHSVTRSISHLVTWSLNHLITGHFSHSYVCWSLGNDQQKYE